MKRKKNKRPPSIDIDMLTMALQSGELDTSWWLDTHSGHVIPAPEEEGDHIEQELIAEKRRSPDRFIEIEPVEEDVHFELMQSYIATLEQGAFCESLYEALQRKRPDWHFKNALSNVPEYEDNWYEFKEQFYAMQARQWLRDRDLELRGVEHSGEYTGKAVEHDLPLGDPWVLMDLNIRVNEQVRRYVIRPRETDLVLIAIGPVADEPEQTLGEMQINQHQISGINKVIETFNPYIGSTVSHQGHDASLRYNNAAFGGEIRGSFAGEGPFNQLAEQLDMLLGIPPLKV